MKLFDRIFKRTVVIKTITYGNPLTYKQQKAFDAAFEKMDEAFKEMSAAFKVKYNGQGNL